MRNQYFEENSVIGQQKSQSQMMQSQRYSWQQPQEQQQFQQQSQQSQPRWFESTVNFKKQVPIVEYESSQSRFQSTSTEEDGTQEYQQQFRSSYNQENPSAERDFLFDSMFSENNLREQQIQQGISDQRITNQDNFMRECIPGANFFQPPQRTFSKPQDNSSRPLFASEFTVSQRSNTHNSFRFWSQFPEEAPCQNDRLNIPQQESYPFHQIQSHNSQYEQISNNTHKPSSHREEEDSSRFYQSSFPLFKQPSRCNHNYTQDKLDQSPNNTDALQAALDSQMNYEPELTHSQPQSHQQSQYLAEVEEKQQSEIQNQLSHQNISELTFNLVNSNNDNNIVLPKDEDFCSKEIMINTNGSSDAQTPCLEMKIDSLKNEEPHEEEGFVFPWFMELMNESKEAMLNSQKSKNKTSQSEKSQTSSFSPILEELTKPAVISLNQPSKSTTKHSTIPNNEKKVLQIELAVDSMANRKRSKKTLFYLASDGKQKKFSRITKSMIRPVCNALAKHMRSLGVKVGRIDWVNQLRQFLLTNENCIPAAIDFFENHFENYVNSSHKLLEKSEYLLFKNNWIQGVSDPLNFHGLKSCCAVSSQDDFKGQQPSSNQIE